MWEKATPFNNQLELNEQELYYINKLVEVGNEVRYDNLSIYNKLPDESTVAGILERSRV